MTKETAEFAAFIEALGALPKTQQEITESYNSCIQKLKKKERTNAPPYIKFEEFALLLKLKEKYGTLEIFL